MSTTLVTAPSSAKLCVPSVLEVEGENKGELGKYFDFGRLEADLYEWWEQSGFFKPEIAAK
jgi:hypothetical protein